MCVLTVRLFGNFQVQRDDQVLNGWKGRKAQELFAYLLLRNERPQARQVLAGLLWPESTTEQAMKYFRHTLWQLQAELDCDALEVDAEYLHLTQGAGLWLDVVEFERTWAYVQRIPGEAMDRQKVYVLREALKLYRGDLLEGWYQDWCLFERERLQRMYLAMLEKQMAYCETQGEYEVGLECGTCALRYDTAHERIHRRLMRLHYLAGDRTAALRQYERCVALLREELGVAPSQRTVALYEQIRSGQLVGPGRSAFGGNGDTSEISPPTLTEALRQLQRLQAVFAGVEHQLQEAIQTVEAALNGKL